MARWWVALARRCHSQEVREHLALLTSSSGGGLPGRPLTRKSRDACLILRASCRSPVARQPERILSPVLSHPFRFPENVTLHSLLDFLLG